MSERKLKEYKENCINLLKYICVIFSWIIYVNTVVVKVLLGGVCYFTNFNFLIWIAAQNMVSPLEIKNMKEFYQKKACNPPVHASWTFLKQGFRIRKACMLDLCSRWCKEKHSEC